PSHPPGLVKLFLSLALLPDIRISLPSILPVTTTSTVETVGSALSLVNALDDDPLPPPAPPPDNAVLAFDNCALTAWAAAVSATPAATSNAPAPGNFNFSKAIFPKPVTISSFPNCAAKSARALNTLSPHFPTPAKALRKSWPNAVSVLP